MYKIMHLNGTKYQMTNMGNWKSKQREKASRFSMGQTPGKKKDANRCQTNAFKNFMAKRSRSYKDPDYPSWCDWTNKINKL